jgi:hypothetical protein
MNQDVRPIIQKRMTCFLLGNGLADRTTGSFRGGPGIGPGRFLYET